MANDVSIKFGVDGEKQFKSALSAVNEQVKSLNGQFTNSVKAMASATDKENALKTAYEKGNETLKAQSKQIETLNEKLTSQKKKYEELKTALDKAINDGDTEKVNKLTVEFNNQASAVYKTEQQLNRANDQYRQTNELLSDLPKTTKDIGKSMEDAGEKASLFGAVLSGQVVSDLIITGLKKLASAIKEVATAAASRADDIMTMASVTGLSTDKLQEFMYMEDLVDVSVETLNGSLSKLTKNMQTASKGTGDAYKAFKELGISVTDASGQLRDNEIVFYEVVDALGKMENETQRDAYAMNIFGKSAKELNPIIDAGSDVLNKYAQEAHNVGYVMSEEVLATNGALQDSFDRMSKAIDVFKNNLGTSFAPVITEAVNSINELILSFNDSEKVGELLGNFVTDIATYLLENIPVFIDTILQMITAIINSLSENMPQFLQLIIDAVTLIAKTLLENTPIILEAGINLIVSLAKALFDSYPYIVESAIQLVSQFGKTLKENFDVLIRNAKTWGKDLIDSFVEGIRASISKVVSAVKEVAGRVKAFLGFSEPTEGALSNFHTFAPDMMKLYAQGMIDNIGLVENASSKVASSINFGNPVGSGQTINSSPIELSINLDGQEFARAVYDPMQNETLRRGVSLVGA